MPEMTGYAKIALPIRVGLVGTGFAAKIRAQTLQAEPRTQLIAVSGRDPERTGAFAEAFAVQAIADWQTLVSREDIDLIVVCTVNSEHSAIVRGAIMAGKHTIVEYPLTLDPDDGAEIIALAAEKGVLLHVEHIELLGGLHQTMREWLGAIGEVYHARYTTIVTQRPSPRKWTFHRSEFGFPLTGALSRLHRFSDLFGAVKSINCQNQYWGGEGEYYGTCLCTAQLRFENSNAIGEVVYGKGEGLWENARKFEVHGANGALIFNGDEGVLIQADKSTPIDLGSRKGLFVRDTEFVLDALLDGKPNYVTPIESLATLRVAAAARVSAETGETAMLVERSRNQHP
jgi:biliverdin reductase